MESSAIRCPFCLLSFPPSQLQSHANSHFEDEDHDDVVVFAAKNEQFVKDQELARHLALSPPSPARPIQHHTMDDEKISCLISFQTRSSFYHVNSPGGLISLLRNCFLSDSNSSTTTVLLSGYVDHFQSLPSEDVGWGCGWRNIQMLSSHLLSIRQDAREALFGGSGFVPDISCLQRWLEIAWEKGFDAAGSQHFNHSVYGSAHRIGTTECAALFRSFGLRARIVDFGTEELKSYSLSVPGTSLGSNVMTTNDMRKSKAFQFYGPMDRYLLSRNHCVSQPDSIANDKSQSSTSYAANRSDRPMENKLPGKKDGHQALFDWVWNYFLEGNSTLSPQNRRIVITERTPLYFQHDGHSRTIVGIQVTRQDNGVMQQNLLIFDPGHRTVALERSLKANSGWKKLIKRGVHTLKKPQYQLCYVDPGIASGEEMEQLKTIDSIFIEF